MPNGVPIGFEMAEKRLTNRTINRHFRRDYIMKVLVLPKSKKESRVNPASIQYNCKIYLLLKNYITKYTKKVNRYCNKIKTVWKRNKPIG